MRPKSEQKEQADRLRVEERLSLDEIQSVVGASKASLSVWLRPYPLTEEERVRRRVQNHKGGFPACPLDGPSKFYRAV